MRIDRYKRRTVIQVKNPANIKESISFTLYDIGVTEAYNRIFLMFETLTKAEDDGVKIHHHK